MGTRRVVEISLSGGGQRVCRFNWCNDLFGSGSSAGEREDRST